MRSRRVSGTASHTPAGESDAQHQDVIAATSQSPPSGTETDPTSADWNQRHELVIRRGDTLFANLHRDRIPRGVIDDILRHYDIAEHRAAAQAEMLLAPYRMTAAEIDEAQSPSGFRGRTGGTSIPSPRNTLTLDAVLNLLEERKKQLYETIESERATPEEREEGLMRLSSLMETLTALASER